LTDFCRSPQYQILRAVLIHAYRRFDMVKPVGTLRTLQIY